MSAAQPKPGRLESPTFLAWVRSQPCRACFSRDRNAQGPSEAHHFPPKGMGGGTIRDDHSMPLCRGHHDQAQQYKISRSLQQRWAHETRSLFLERASSVQLVKFFEDVLAWKRRPFAEQVPA